MRKSWSILLFITSFSTAIYLLLLLNSCEDSQKEIPAPTIYLDMPDDGYELELKDTIILSPKITYDYNSVYQWYLNGEKSITTRTLTQISDKLGENIYSFVIENPQGKDSVVIPVKTIILVDYEEFELNEDSFDIGAELPVETPWFSSEGLTFPVITTSKTRWNGFAMSNCYSQSTSSTDSLCAYVSSASNFLMYHHQSDSPSNEAISFDDGENHLVNSISVCNSTQTYLAIKYGTDDIKRFGGDSNDDKDWFLITFKGYDKNGTYTGSSEFYLADYRFDNNKSNYIINTWTTVDLTSMGEVNKIELVLTSSVNDDNGTMLTPSFVCIDDIKVLN